MATLRDPLFRQSSVTPQDLEALDASGMTDVGRGFASGRIGNDMNALAAEELNVRAAGDIARADSLRGQVDALGQRQQMYAPAVGKVEDITGVGSGLRWAGGQIGQGVASMTDPLAASAAIGGVSRAVGALPFPIAKGIGAVGQAASLAVPFLMNQRQMTGEFANEAYRDTELMARTSPTELRNTANLYGAGAGALDTVLPGMVGRQLTGAGLRKGLSAMGPGTKTILGLAGEGLTETGQSMGSQFTQGLLNPNRNTSGDFSENINSFAGGFAGAVPFTAAGAYADAGYRRVGDTAETLGKKAGEVIDLAQRTAQPYIDSATKAAQPYIDSAKDTVRGQVVDLKAQGAADYSKSLMDKLTEGAQDLMKPAPRAPNEEQDILMANMPGGLDDIKAGEWMVQNDIKRDKLIIDKLQAMDDPEANAMFDKIVAVQENDGDQLPVFEEAANFIMERMPYGRGNERSEKINGIGEVAGKVLGAAGTVVGKGAVTAGKGALGFGKAVISGVKDGMSKKNMQSNEPAEESFMAWRDNHYGVDGQKAADQALDKGASYNKAVEFNQRADLAGSYAADMAQRGKLRSPGAGKLARQLAFNLAEMIDSTDTGGAEVMGNAGITARVVRMNRVVADFHDIYGSKAPAVLQQLGSILGPNAGEAVNHMVAELEKQVAPGGRKYIADNRAALADQVVGMLGVAERKKLLDQGINLHEPRQAALVLKQLEDYADGIGTERSTAMRKVLDQYSGKDGVDAVMTMLNGQDEREQVGSVVDDRSQSVTEESEDPNADDDQNEGITRFEKNAAEKNLAKGTGEKLYAFHGEAKIRQEGLEKSEPFGETGEPDANGVASRPRLFKLGQQLFGGKGDAIAKKIADVKAQLAEDSEYPDHDNYQIEARSAYDVLKATGAQEGKMLQIFRDYAHAGYHDSALSPEEKRAAARISGLAGKMIVDLIEMQDNKGKTRQGQSYRTTPAERKEVRETAEKFFKNRYVVVGEKLSESVPEKITFTELRTMSLAGRDALDWARKNALVNGVVDERMEDELTSAANVIVFAGKPDKDGKPGPDVAIPAGKLVMWAKQQQGKMEKPGKEESFSDAQKNTSYRKAVASAVAAIMDSGLVAAPTKGMSDEQKRALWPYKLNEGGEAESFADGVPPSLRLAKGLQAEGERLTAERRAKKQAKFGQGDLQKFQGADQEKVGADQERGEDPFVADPLEERQPGGQGLELRSKETQSARLPADADGVVSDEFDAEISRIAKAPYVSKDGRQLENTRSTDSAGNRLTADRSGQTSARAKTGDDDATELDFFPPRKDGEMAGDFDDQQYLTEQMGQGFTPPKTKMAAMSAAKRTAEKITKLMMDDPRMGRDLIMSHLRMAMNEGRYNPSGLVDDAYQIAPIINLIAPGNVARFIKQGAAPNMVDGMKRAALTVLIRAANGENEISSSHLDKLTAQLGVPNDLKKMQALLIERGPVDIDKLNAYVSPKNSNPVKTQTRVGVATKPASAPIAAKAEPVAKEVAAGLGKPLGGVDLGGTTQFAPKDQAKSDRANKFIGRGSAASSTALYAKKWGSRANTGVYAADDSVFISAEGKRGGRIDPDFAEIKRATDAGATLITDVPLARNGRDHNVGERQVAEFLTVNGYAESKPGVWTPGKVSLADSGGRKLNAMANQIHASLGRSGFAATHDSPIKHEGKFDWRKHQGKGEGNAAFGAGTYLSTAEGVHKSYKRDFTAQVGGGENTVEIDGEDVATPWNKSAKYKKLSLAERSVLTQMYRDRSLLGETLRQAVLKDAITDADSAFENMVYDKSESMTQAFDYLEDEDFAPGEADAIRANAEALMVAAGMDNRAYDKNGNYFDTRSRVDKEALFKVFTDPGDRSVIEGYLNVESTIDEVKGLDLTRFSHKEKSLSPTYEVSVDIPAEQLLDWNAPFEQQSDLVQKATSKLLSSPDAKIRDAADLFVNGMGKIRQDAGLFYNRLTFDLGSQAKVSDYLQSLGILGHKYAAEGGRNDAEPNYVIYDDAKISTNYVHFNQQSPGNARVATQAEMDEAVAYADKLFGKGGVTVLFKDITGHSGEFIEATNTIILSTTAAAGTMNTLYHEALHKFFAQYVRSNPKLQVVFENLINDPKHLKKLHDLLAGYPAAQAQLTSGEERLAYTYQFWKAGLLTVDATANTWLQKIGKFFRAVLGKVRDSERALAIFQAFDNGKMSTPSAAGQVIAKAMDAGGNAMKVRRKLDGLIQGVAALTFPAGEILGRSASPAARKLSTMFYTNPGDEAHGTEGEGLLNAQRRVSMKYNNVAQSTFKDMAEGDQLSVQKYLQQGTTLAAIPLTEHREAVKTIRVLLERFHEHMTDSGLNIGKIDNYYPTVWSAGALLAKKPEFIAMLVTKYPQHLDTKFAGKNQKDPAAAAERIWQSLVDKEGVDAHLPAGRSDGVLAPFFASQEGRTLPWLEGVDKEAFLDKNLVNTLTRYFHQGARASEYHRRFGENGTLLDSMLKRVDKEIDTASREKLRSGEIKGEKQRIEWSARQMRDISQSTGAMEGTLGKDMSPNMRSFNSWMAVYQNIRLLPMSLFSSFVDPLGIMARGAPLQAAYESFVYGMREVFRTWGDAFRDMPPQRAADEWQQLAEHIGATEIAMFSHHASDQYASVYMTPGAKKLNDKMFKFNGMEAWNRGMRVQATKWAVRFVEKHAGLPDKTHSARWLKEIGLDPSMITLDGEGKLVTNRHQLAKLKGITLEQATAQMELIHRGLGRWVEGAVLTPSAGQRPAWMSDPNFTMFGHLKQFSYSFHQTILKRAVSEFKHGNMAPVGALAMFIPTMITADLMKGLVQGGGSLPPYMASMNAGDWLMHGYQRAGLAGVGVIGVDAMHDPSSLGGPAIEQIVDGLRDEGGKTLINALPLHALYAQALK